MYKKILWNKQNRAKKKSQVSQSKFTRQKKRQEKNVIFIIKNDEIKNYTLCFATLLHAHFGNAFPINSLNVHSMLFVMKCFNFPFYVSLAKSFSFWLWWNMRRIKCIT